MPVCLYTELSSFVNTIFIGNSQKIPAHKYILATGSSVFFAMFHGGLAEDKARDIEVPDVDPQAFHILLR